MTITKLAHNEAQVAKAVCTYMNLSWKQLNSKARFRRLSYGRQLCMYMLKNHTRMSKSDIGKLFEKDHSTVIFSLNQIDNFLKFDEVVQKDISTIKTMIGA